MPICAPKDRFTRVLAASFTGAPRYTREVFILGSRSSPFSSPSVADTFCPKSLQKIQKNQKKLKRRSVRGGATGLNPYCSVEEEVVLWFGMRTGSAY